YRESDTGKKSGRAIKSFDDMGSLESWARDNGHTELADYAKAEQANTGAPSAPAAKKVTDPATILSSLPADLTPAQKRARLRSRGVPKEQIDALVPLKAKEAAPFDPYDAAHSI